MRHEYYYYNKEQLLANPKIPMVVMEDKPAVLMGDFNMTPDHAALKPLVEDADIQYLDTGFTFPSDAPVKKIDYIFANKYVKVENVYVPDLVVSDHRPIVAEIEF